MKKILANGAFCALLFPVAPVSAALDSAPKKSSIAPKTSENLEKLPNGVTFIAKTDRFAPRVAFSILIPLGANAETSETAGWRRLIASATLRSVPAGFAGAESSEENALAVAAQNLGAEVGVTVGDDFIEYYGIGDSARVEKWLPLLIALWQKPVLSDAPLDATRARQRAGAEAQDLDVAQITASALQAQLFRDSRGEFLAYGLPLFGTEKSLENLTNERLRALQSQFLSAKVTVSATGDVDLATTRALLSAIPQITVTEAPAPQFAPLKKGQPAFVLREIPTVAASVVISYPMGRVSDADAPAMRVLAALLSEARDARLSKRLLGQSLVQGAPTALAVSGQWIPRRYGSELLLTAQTATQSVEGVKNALIDEVRKLGEGKISPKELQNAQNYARGSWSLERQNPRERAFFIAQNSALGLSPDSSWPRRIMAVKATDINRVAKKYLGSYAVALIMPRD